MSVIPQKRGTKGSLKAIQDLINLDSSKLDSDIKKRIKARDTIDWRSPLENKDRPELRYAEYRDTDFLKLLGLDRLTADLKMFWPIRGPQWDFFGIAGQTVLLGEAKSHISEVISHCSAKSIDSRTKIQAALDETKRALGIKSPTSWLSPYYQYANRIAHLQFLLCHHVDAYLIFVNFTNDTTMPDPATAAQWQGAMSLVHASLGIKQSFRQKHIIDVFIEPLV